MAASSAVAGAVGAGFAVGLLLQRTGVLGPHPFSLYLAAGSAAWLLATVTTQVPRPLRLRRTKRGTVALAEGTRHAVEVPGGTDALRAQLDPRGRVRALTLLDGKGRPVLLLDAPDPETLAAVRRMVGAETLTTPVRRESAAPPRVRVQADPAPWPEEVPARGRADEVTRAR